MYNSRHQSQNRKAPSSPQRVLACLKSFYYTYKNVILTPLIIETEVLVETSLTYSLQMAFRWFSEASRRPLRALQIPQMATQGLQMATLGIWMATQGLWMAE